MKPPETRYAWNGDVSLAYQVVGDGPVDLLYLPGVFSNVDVMWESRQFARFLRGLASFSRLIVMDRRGVGCSERYAPNQVAPLEVMVDDVMVVLDDVRSDAAAFFGNDESAFIVCMIAASRPDRVSHAVLFEPYPTWTRDDEVTWEWSSRDWDEQITRLRNEWGARSDELTAKVLPSIAEDEREADWLSKFERATQSPGLCVAETRKYSQTDIRGILPAIHVPTLVLHRADGGFVDVRSPRYVADGITGAKLVEVPGSDSVPWAGETDAIVEEIEAFVTGVRHAPETDLVLATVLFTDIVGSTERQAAVGDRAWKDLIERHHAAVRESLVRWRGTENDTAGDGFFAAFDGPARAIHCALEIARRVADLGIEIRAGIHCGECELADGKHAGLAVTIGARVGALGGPSEVLVTQTVKDLVAGSGLRFEARGEHELKGVPEHWKLYRASAAE